MTIRELISTLKLINDQDQEIDSDDLKKIFGLQCRFTAMMQKAEETKESEYFYKMWTQGANETMEQIKGFKAE